MSKTQEVVMKGLPRGLRSQGHIYCDSCGNKQNFTIVISDAKIVIAKPIYNRKGGLEGFKPRVVA